MGSNGIDPLTAAELSQAAYIPWAEYSQGADLITGFSTTGLSTTLRQAGWVVDVAHSGVDSTSNNQFITFVNVAAQEVVIAFKGSDNLSNFTSDIVDSGGAEWERLLPQFSGKFNGLQGISNVYAGYQIMTDGHSLGGGMAQTAALEFGLSGYGQNSLPVSNE